MPTCLAVPASNRPMSHAYLQGRLPGSRQSMSPCPSVHRGHPGLCRRCRRGRAVGVSQGDLSRPTHMWSTQYGVPRARELSRPRELLCTYRHFRARAPCGYVRSIWGGRRRRDRHMGRAGTRTIGLQATCLLGHEECPDP